MKHKVKIYNAAGDLSKRWYVEYYNPKRRRDYGYANKEKLLCRRLKLISELKNAVVDDLEAKESKAKLLPCDDKHSTTYYINFYLREKGKTVSAVTLESYKKFLKFFHRFLIYKGLHKAPPAMITKYVIYEFREDLASRLTNRGVNNYIDCIKGFFSYIIKRFENVLVKNPCHDLIKISSNSESNVAYSKSQAEAISRYLSEHDPLILSYCRFIAYGFLRCTETRFLRVRDIDFDRRTITLPVNNIKSKKRTVKPMMDVFFQYLLKMQIKGYPGDYFVFTTSGRPGPVAASESFYTHRYAKVKKHFNLPDIYTVYSFRHTFVSELLSSGANWREIMKYTGHTTMAAFEKYARSLMDKPAEDLSTHIKINF